MAIVDNSRQLSKFIDENNVGNCTIENFFEEFPRLCGQLYIKEISCKPIYRKAIDQIDVIEKVINAIHSAAEILKKEPDEIKKACQEIVSIIPEINTDLFETALLDATKLLGSKSGSIGVEFRNFCSIRRDILPIMSNLEAEKRDEKLTPIKNKLLSVISMPRINRDQIKAIFLNKVINEIFEPLLENLKISELNNEHEQIGKSKKKAKKDCLKKLLEHILHPNVTFANATFLCRQGQGHYIFFDPKNRRIDLNCTDDGWLIEETFLTQKVKNLITSEEFETEGENFFVKAQAKYEISIRTCNRDGWVIKYYLIDSTLECKEEFKTILDTRNFLEKFRKFLKTSLDKIIAYLNSDQSVKNKPKFKPHFFVSNPESPVSKILPDTESNGNILNLIINDMK